MAPALMGTVIKESQNKWATPLCEKGHEGKSQGIIRNRSNNGGPTLSGTKSP